MAKYPDDEKSFRYACFGFSLAGAMAVLSVALIGISCLKMLVDYPNASSGQFLRIASPIVSFLQGKTLWDLVPALEVGCPLGIANILFWICVGVFMATVRIAVSSRRERDSQSNAETGPWRIPASCAGPVTNYTVMFTGPVTNPQVMQMVDSAAEAGRISSDLERLMLAVANEAQLPEEKKRDACDLLHTIAEEAKRPQTERKTAVVKAVLNSVPVVISTAKSLVDLWTEIQPHLISFFR